MSQTVQHRRDSRANIEAATPADGELGWDQTLKAIRMGDGATLGGLLMKKWRYSYPVSPAQITADQNNYNPTDLGIAETLLLTSDAARSVTGIAAGVAGARMSIVNRGSFDITLKDASASSTAANRFQFGADVVLKANGAVELQYSGGDSRWMRANGGAKFSVVQEELLLSGVITPAQITADKNDYAPTDSVTATKTTALASILRLSSDASRNITGLVDPRDGAVKTIINAGTNPIVLKDASTSSTAANRFDFGADITLAAKQSATIRYDGTDSRWKLEAATAGGAVAAGAVTAQTLAASGLGASVSMVNGAIAESHAGSAVTFALKTLAGADPTAGDPVLFVFPDGAGGFVVRTVIAAMSLVISSGSSLGIGATSQAFRIWIGAFDDGGTVRLCAGVFSVPGTSLQTYPVNEGVPGSSTAEGGAGAADSPGVLYTGTAVTAKFFRLIGYADYETGLASPGAWASSPTRIMQVGPGGPRPGTRLQRKRFNTSTPTTTTSTSYVDSNLSVTITPTSPINFVDVAWFSDVSTNNGTSGGFVSLFNGATQLWPLQTLYNSGSTGGFAPVAGKYTDAPQVNTSITYKLRLKSGGASTTASLPSSSGQATIEAEEIMA